MDQDVAVFEHGLHRRGVGHEVGAQVAAVELHALDPLDLGLERLAFLDRDDAVLADLFGRLGDHLADLGIEVRGDRRDLLGLGLGRDLGAHLVELLDDVGDGLVHPSLHQHGVDARDDRLQPLVVDRLGQHGGRGRAVAGDVGGLARDLLHHLGAHVLVLVFQLDFLGDGHAVLGHRRRAERLLDDDVPAPRAERHLHRAGQLGNPALHRLAGFLIERDHFGCHTMFHSQSKGIKIRVCAAFSRFRLSVGEGR